MPRIGQFSIHRTALALCCTLFAVWCAVFANLDAARAQEDATSANPSGLALPRFAATRSEKVNVRFGPGTQYDIAWVFVKPDLPVEVIQEFDTWRKIRDVEGAEGWVHQNLLTGRRNGIIVPAEADDMVALRAGPALDEDVRAWLLNGLVVGLLDCDGAWCEVSAQSDNDTQIYRGFIRQIDIWGAYQGERFD